MGGKTPTMTKTITVPEMVLRLALAAREEGGRALLIGGAVRDSLRLDDPAQEIKDYDVEVFGIEAARLRELLGRLFGEVNTVGEAFAVYKCGDLDVSLPRREQKTGGGHRDFLITGDPYMTVEEAARRRDLTVNALSYDPLTEELLDPFGGREDLRRRVLRMICPETFAEDPLRVLRIAQFAARFAYDIDDETAILCRTLPLKALPAERVQGEMIKLLLKGRHPNLGLSALEALEVNEELFPELLALYGVQQSPKWHPEGDVYTHTRLVVREARRLVDGLPYPKQLAVMFAALCHDFGKPATTEWVDGDWRARGHEAAGRAPALAFLDRLKVNRFEGYPVREQVAALVEHHLKPAEFSLRQERVTDAAYRRLALKVDLRLLYLVSKADVLGRRGDERFAQAAGLYTFLERAERLDVAGSAPRPLLLGRHLIEMGLRPSKRFGEIIAEVFEQQLEGAVRTEEEAVEAARRIVGDSLPAGEAAAA